MDWTRCDALEIGALHNPILRRPQACVAYLDHADAATLRQKYADHHDLDVTAIVDVDFVWNEGRLGNVVGDRRFDHVIASHVIEHIPDPIWWLGEIESVLRPFGTLRLIVPDKRYTFDFARRETTLADLLASYVARQRRPGPRDILDFWLGYRGVDATAAWRGDYPQAVSPTKADVSAALRRARESVDCGVYHDAHCSVFTPASFVANLAALAQNGMLGFACNAILPTEPGELDFFVTMMKCDDAARIDESWRWAAWTISLLTTV